MNTAYIGIGSNQHNPKYHVVKGIRDINHLPKIDIQKKSSLYETLPVGPQNQPNFINAVIKIATSYQPRELLTILQSIEKKHHRKRTKKWGPRTLDLDILIYDDIILDSDVLKIPHPEIIHRDFVLIPLLEITGYNFRMPKFGKLIQYV